MTPVVQNTGWKSMNETLTDIFAGYVNQQTLEEGADQMAFVSSDNPDYHRRFMEAIDRGIESIETDFLSVKEIINKSGYTVSTRDETSNLMHELRRLYLERYEREAT